MLLLGPRVEDLRQPWGRVGNGTSYLCWREREHKRRLKKGATGGPWHQGSWDTGIPESGKLPDFLWAPNWSV